MFWGVCCSFLMNLSEWLCFIRHCRRIWSKPTVWQRCTGSSVSLWRQNCHKSERKGTWAGKYLRYHCCTGACVYKIIIHVYVFYGNLQFCCHYYFGLNKPLCAGAFRQNGQASSADDSALRGAGEEEGHGGGGLQDGPETTQAKIQRCRKTTHQGKTKMCLLMSFPSFSCLEYKKIICCFKVFS